VEVEITRERRAQINRNVAVADVSFAAFLDPLVTDRRRRVVLVFRLWTTADMCWRLSPRARC
jgi:hypothetical protein